MENSMMNRTLSIIAGFLMLAGVAANAQDKVGERWIYWKAGLTTDAGLKASLEMLEQAKLSGVTHIHLADGAWMRQSENQSYLKRVAEFKAACEQAKIKVAPGVYAIGYSGRYLPSNKNLAAGLPVHDMVFIVKGDKATVDMSQSLEAGKLDGDGFAKVTAKPFTHYRINVAVKSEPTGELDEIVRVTSLKAKRWLTRRMPVAKKQDGQWVVTTTFNTLEDGDLRVLCKLKDVVSIKIEPEGLSRVIRRDMTPLKITSDDGKTVYEEGKDFEKIVDPDIAKGGEYDMDADGPDIELTKNSRIKNGQKLKVSFFHAYRMGKDQDIISTQDPAVFDLMEKDISLAVKVWGTDGYVMGYDEIRIGGWEIEPNGKTRTPGEILAWHTKHAVDLIKKHAPKAKVYAWSSMWNPEHNARPFAVKGYYYLVNGNWDGSWEGLPKDVIIFNWYAPKPESIKWFAERGHKQILGAYYDGKDTEAMKNNIQRWHDMSAGQKGVIGWQYTTWRNNSKNIAEFFKLLDSFSKWGKGGTGAVESEPGVKN